MHPKFPHVFEPITIRGKVYKNRLIAAPTMFAHSIFTIPPMKENVYRMVENRAKGGFGAVSTGEHPVNAEEGTALFYEHHMDFTKPEGPDFEAIKEYADRIKKLLFAVLSAEVRVNYVKVGNANLLSLLSKLKGIIDGNISFATAVVPCKQRYSFTLHLNHLFILSFIITYFS